MNTPFQQAAQKALEAITIASLADAAQTMEPDKISCKNQVLWYEVTPDNWDTLRDIVTKMIDVHPTQPAGEREKVGDSRFESWYSELHQAGKGSKQIAREAYEAGLNEAQQVESNPWLIRKEPNTKDTYYIAEGTPPDNVLEVYGIIQEAPLRECHYESPVLKICSKCGQMHDKSIFSTQGN